LGFEEAVLYSINSSGLAVGGARRPLGQGMEYHAFLYDIVEGWTDLNTVIEPNSGWTLCEARDVNDQGWIVGWGWSPNGQSHGFVLIPVPEPGTLVLLLTAGLVGLLIYTWREQPDMA